MDISQLVKGAASGVMNKPQSPVGGIPIPVDPTAIESLYSSGGQQRAMYDMINEEQLRLQNELTNLYDNPAVSPMSYSDYYPNQQRGINVGSFSGETFSAPIFAASGVVPMARFDAINKAKYDNKLKQIEEAAAANSGIFKDLKAPELSDPYAQQQFNEMFYKDVDSFVQEYMKAYPENWQKMLQNSPEFNRMLGNYDVLGRSGDQLSQDIAQTQADLESGDLILSKEGLAAFEELKGGISSIGTKDFNNVSLRQKHNILKGDRSLTFIMENVGVLDKAKAHIEDLVTKYQSGQGTDTFQVETKKDFNEFANDMTEELFRGPLANSKIYTKAQVKSMLLNYLGSESTKKLQAVDNGGMTAYQKAVIGLENEKLKMAKAAAANDPLQQAYLNRVETILAAKHGVSVGTGVGSSSFGGKSTNEKFIWIDPNKKYETMTDQQIKALYPWLTAAERTPENLNKIKDQTFVVVDVNEGGATKRVGISNSDPDFFMKYNAYLSGNDTGEGVKIDDDMVRKLYEGIVASSATGSQGSATTQSAATPITLSGDINKSTLVIGQEYVVNGKSYTWNGTNLIEKK